MEWVHCNKCFLLKDKISIYITSCCHLLCKKCLRQKCPICNQAVKAVEINNTMPVSVANYFEDIPKTILKLKKAIKFQFEHRSRYEEVKSRRFEDIRKMKEIREKVEKSNRSYEEKIKQEINKIKKLQAYVAHCKSKRKENITLFQTPARSSRRLDAHRHSSGFLQPVDMNLSFSSSAAPRKNLEAPSFFARNSADKTGYITNDDTSIRLRNNSLQGTRAENTFFKRDDTGYHTPTTANTCRNPTLESLRFGNLF